jgi:hypothetical protein
MPPALFRNACPARVACAVTGFIPKRSGVKCESRPALKITLEHLTRIKQNVPTCFFKHDASTDNTQNL